MTDYTKIAIDISDAIVYISKQGWKISYHTFDTTSKTVDILSALKLFDLKYVFAENYTRDEIADMQILLTTTGINKIYPDLTVKDCMYFILTLDRLKANILDCPEEPVEAVKCFNILTEMKKLDTYDNVVAVIA